jgi:GcrA cell cycle regulator
MKLPSRPSPIRAAPAAPSDAQQRRMRDLVAKGYTRPQIAALMGEKLSQVHHWAQQLGMARTRGVGANSAQSVARAWQATEALRAEASRRHAQQGGGAEPGPAAHQTPAPPRVAAGEPGPGGSIARAVAGCGGMVVSSLDLPPAVATRPAVFSGLRGGCRWPLGDPKTAGFRFCDAARVRGAYCAEHGAKAYVGRGGAEMPPAATLGGWR